MFNQERSVQRHDTHPITQDAYVAETFPKLRELINQRLHLMEQDVVQEKADIVKRVSQRSGLGGIFSQVKELLENRNKPPQGPKLQRALQNACAQIFSEWRKRYFPDVKAIQVTDDYYLLKNGALCNRETLEDFNFAKTGEVITLAYILAGQARTQDLLNRAARNAAQKPFNISK